MFITVTGMGYVGLVTGACLAYLGNRVCCYDCDKNKIDKLKNGIVSVYERGLKELTKISMDAGLLTFTNDPVDAYKNAEVIIIAVGTPPLETGKPDLGSIDSVARQIGKELNTKKYTVIINKSTVPVGTWKRISSILKSEADDKHDHFGLVSNPEFLREGNAISDTLYPSRIVLGSCSRRAVETVKKLYDSILCQNIQENRAMISKPHGFTKTELIETTPTSAEMIKYASNAFLAAKISFINEIANICDLVGADITVVSKGIGLDPRIGKDFLKAGIGWGGSCFGKDIAALIHTAEINSYHPELIGAVMQVNYRQRLLLIARLKETIGDLKGSTIGILGLSFKPETSDLRDAPSIDIIKRLLEQGALIKAYDPASMENCREQHPELPLSYAKDALEAASGADALVIVTDWEEFRKLNPDRIKRVMKKAVIIDGRNMLEPGRFIEKGFTYRGIGR